MGKGLRAIRPHWLSGKRLFVLNAILFLIPISYFSYQPLLRFSVFLVVSSGQPVASDVIVVLAGGEPGRAWEAAELYRERLAPIVAVTSDLPTSDELELKRRGFVLDTNQENYVRVLRGMGVPDESILRIEPAVEDTFDELTRVRDFAKKENWRSIILVTSNYHSRRTGLTAGYLFPENLRFTVVASRHGGLDRENWWTRTSQVRTFLIEFEKLVVYTCYIWPRRVIGLWSRPSVTKPSSTSSVSPAFSSTFSFSSS